MKQWVPGFWAGSTYVWSLKFQLIKFYSNITNFSRKLWVLSLRKNKILKDHNVTDCNFHIYTTIEDLLQEVSINSFLCKIKGYIHLHNYEHSTSKVGPCNYNQLLSLATCTFCLQPSCLCINFVPLLYVPKGENKQRLMFFFILYFSS